MCDPLPLSLLNDYLYCSRRAALKAIEGWHSSNEHTARGEIAHKHTDLRGYEVAKGVILLRALPVFSDRLGLNGKCDIVEQHPNNMWFPVEFKIGKRRKWINDDAQLCAQALCLEEMFSTTIPCGAVFHADSKRRREVEFTAHLRKITEAAISELHALLTSMTVPSAVYRDVCEECSLYKICLPRATETAPLAKQLTAQLFQT